jgi:hypothetical protein
VVSDERPRIGNLKCFLINFMMCDPNLPTTGH